MCANNGTSKLLKRLLRGFLIIDSEYIDHTQGHQRILRSHKNMLEKATKQGRKVLNISHKDINTNLYQTRQYKWRIAHDNGISSNVNFNADYSSPKTHPPKNN